VNEVRRLNGTPRVFLGKVHRGERSELVVHERQELVQSGLITGPNIHEELCYFTGRRKHREDAS
jgi:hypothetical protein